MKTDYSTLAENEIQLETLLHDEKFGEAFHLLQGKEKQQLLSYLQDYTPKKLSLKKAYRFCQYSISEQPTEIFWQKTAFQIAYLLSEENHNYKQKALSHLLDAIKLDTADWKLKEEALQFYDGGLLPENYAKVFAEIVIRINPTSRKAMRVLEYELDVY